jgi:hypothetical protein
LDEELEAAYDVAAAGTFDGLGIHPDKDIVLAKGSKDCLGTRGSKAWKAFTDLVKKVDIGVRKANKKRYSKKEVAELVNDFHSKTGGWIYRHRGAALGNQRVYQRLSCKDFVRSTPSRQVSTLRLLVRQAREDLQKPKDPPAPPPPRKRTVTPATVASKRKKAPVRSPSMSDRRLFVSPDEEEEVIGTIDDDGNETLFAAASDHKKVPARPPPVSDRRRLVSPDEEEEVIGIIDDDGNETLF